MFLKEIKINQLCTAIYKSHTQIKPTTMITKHKLLNGPDISLQILCIITAI